MSRPATILLALLGAALIAVAPVPVACADPPLPITTLSPTPGDTFFNFMVQHVKPTLDTQYNRSFTITTAAKFSAVANNFAHIQEIRRGFIDPVNGLETLVGRVAGQSVRMKDMFVTVIKNKDLFKNQGSYSTRLAGMIGPVIGLASGTGVAVTLDANNYVYNWGYAIGSNGTNSTWDSQDRKSGRSYGASVTRNAYDPSDNDYLREMALYASDASDAELTAWFHAVFTLLLKGDGSLIAKVAHEGQLVFADFMAIYMAELDRHLMTGLKYYEWENALTEISLLAPFSASPDGATLDPRGGSNNTLNKTLCRSDLLDAEDRLLGYFGVGTNGSGLDGRNKQRRHVLTKGICKQMLTLEPQLMADLAQAIGVKQTADLYDEVMEFINNFKTQATVKTRATTLIKLLAQFAISTRKHAAAITAALNVSPTTAVAGDLPSNSATAAVLDFAESDSP